MNDIVKIEEKKPEQPQWIQQMINAQPRFEELAKIHGAVNWKAEANFAKQLFYKNENLRDCTAQSIYNAILNVGAVGLTLSPAEKHAHLVPRNRKLPDGTYISECQFEIGYQGLIKLATETGNCDYVRADVVREKDDFIYHGPAQAPELSIQPFGDRGEIIGCYAIAKLASSDTLCEIMTAEEISATEEASKAKFGPWKGPFRAEMIKKTVLKRLCKTIPRSDNSGRLHNAIKIVNDYEGLADTQDSPTLSNMPSTDDINRFQKALQDSDALAIFQLSQTLDTGVWINLYNSAEKGQKTKQKELVTRLEKEGRGIVIDLKDAFTADNQDGAHDILTDIEDRAILYEMLDSEVVQWLDEVMPEVAA